MKTISKISLLLMIGLLFGCASGGYYSYSYGVTDPYYTPAPIGGPNFYYEETYTYDPLNYYYDGFDTLWRY